MRHINSIPGIAFGFLILLAAMKPVPACSDGSQDSAQSPSSSLQEAKSSPDVEFEPQRKLLKVTAQGQTMDQVLAAITDETNIHFTRYASDCGRVSVQFDFLPLQAALAQVLKGRNYVLSRSANHDSIAVWVLPAKTLSATEIVVQEFYKEFEGLPETERFAGELKLVELELSGIQAEVRDMEAPEGILPLENTLLHE